MLFTSTRSVTQSRADRLQRRHFRPAPETDQSDILGSLPADFDAEACPIIARHFFGLRSRAEIADKVPLNLPVTDGDSHLSSPLYQVA